MIYDASWGGEAEGSGEDPLCEMITSFVFCLLPSILAFFGNKP